MKAQIKQADYKSFFFFLGFVVSILAVYVALKLNSYEKAYIPVSMFALIMGLLFEYRRISRNWSYVLYITLGSFVLGFIVLLMGKEEGANLFDKDIIILPLAFLFFFVSIAVVVHEKNIVAHLTEGITLMQSIAMIYFILDTGCLQSRFIPLKLLGILGGLISLTVIFYSLSSFELSKKSRFRLSIWSSVIMVILAADNIFHVYLNEPIEATNDFWQAGYIGTQYFLLGVASIYIAQNFFMLMDFIPGKAPKSWQGYLNHFYHLRGKHIMRYSRQQIKIPQGLLCLLLCSAMFGLNYYFRFVPRSFLIWSVFILFPMIADFIFTEKNTTQKVTPGERTATVQVTARMKD